MSEMKSPSEYEINMSNNELDKELPELLELTKERLDRLSEKMPTVANALVFSCISLQDVKEQKASGKSGLFGASQDLTNALWGYTEFWSDIIVKEDQEIKESVKQKLEKVDKALFELGY